MSTSSIPAERYAQRLARVQALLPAEDASALLVGVGADLQWLTGYDAHALERLTLLVVTPSGRPTLVVPRLELAAAQACTAADAGLVELHSWQETEDPFAVIGSLLQATKSRPEIQVGALGGTWGRLGGLLVSDRLWATFLLRLQAVVPDAAFGLASTVLSGLRAVKGEEEIELLRRAAHAADRVIGQVARGRLVGRSEGDVAREVRERLVAEGHEEAAFWIVASGPNSASPHHAPGERIIAAGEAVVLDIGGVMEGYASDITRTIWISADGRAPDDDFARLYDVLRRAQAAGRDAVAPGVPCEQIDAAARAVIGAAGLGEHFIHRTGHGIGLEGHEDPYLVEGNIDLLREGNTFSVEPGIYLDGRFGARIEDIVVCRADGADVLNEAPRELLVVSG